MVEERKVAKLDLSDFKPKTSVAITAAQDKAAVEEGKRHGFTSRAETQKIDGRVLRRKGKEQMNMRISPSVQQEFRQILADFPDADACLAHLIQIYRAV